MLPDYKRTKLIKNNKLWIIINRNITIISVKIIVRKYK